VFGLQVDVLVPLLPGHMTILAGADSFTTGKREMRSPRRQGDRSKPLAKGDLQLHPVTSQLAGPSLLWLAVIGLLERMRCIPACRAGSCGPSPVQGLGSSLAYFSGPEG